ncbi:GntR family transcriptional regulator [Niveispirillum sp.]|uniref:GntR family transcriptional regulator n=1 Tax=Niveispirillum sp. TaxID=1917217 RepID=UPI001B5536F4|nr:GntR family transcriptional regulator [Niveispirillum sp.]MBP7335585.1 GntR family transcriptional regulator [Niveispirillum sp.]
MVVGRRGALSKEGSSLPVYHQLYVVLRQQIIDGAYSQTTPLPTEMALAAQFNLSRVTVRRALEVLEREGLVVRRQGVGTFPAPQEGGAASPPRLSGLIENLITIGVETTAQTLAHDTDVPLPAAATMALKLPPGSRGVRLERLRSHKDRPVSLTEVYLPPESAHLLKGQAMDDRPVVRILEQAGLIAVSAEQSISAMAANDDVSEKLGVAIGSPVIRLRRTVFDREGRPILHQQSLYNPDRYEYYMLLTRDNSTSRPQWRHIG